MRVSSVSLALLLVPWLACDGDGVAGDDGATKPHCARCDLDHWMPALAAEGAVDCGRVRLGQSPIVAADCVEAALASKSAFVVRQELQGIDSQVEIGFLVDQDGVVQQLTHDSNLCGAPTCTDHCGPVVWVQECVSPRRGAAPMHAVVDCDPGETAVLCEPQPPS
jgi:hypothetical protein